MIKIIFFFKFFIFLSYLYGCSPAGILASGGATTMVVAEGDRSLLGQLLMMQQLN